MRHLVLAVILFFSAVPAMAQVVSCGEVNWVHLGWSDGVAGQENRSRSFQESCGWDERSDPALHYEAGYVAGINSYCRQEISFREGVQNSDFRLAHCPPELRETLSVGYLQGRSRGQLHWIFHGLGFLLSFVVLIFAFKYREALENGSIRVWDSKLISVFFLALASGILLRILFLQSPGLGTFLYEEMSVTLVYIDKMYSGVQSSTGATNLTFYLISTFWKWLLGPGLVASRVLTLLLNLGSMILLFFSSRFLLGSLAAFATTSLYALNIYGISLSILAIETSWTLFFSALVIYLCTRVLAHPESKVWKILLGFGICAGVLTYPGFTVWILGAVATYVLISFFRKSWSWRATFLVGGGFLLGMIPALIYHFQKQAAAPFLKGGGGILSANESYWTALGANLKDIFILAHTYYLQQSTSLVESWNWGFFLVGVWCLLHGRSRAWAWSLLASMASILILSSLATNLPGMRRGIAFLIPFYIFAGAGLAAFAQLTLSVGRLGNFIFKTGVFLVLAVSISLTALRLNDRENNAPYMIFGELLTHPELNRWLQTENFALILDGTGDVNSFVAQVYQAYAKFLALKTKEPIKNFSVLDGATGYFPKDLREKDSYYLLLESQTLTEMVSRQTCTEFKKDLPFVLGTLHLVKVIKCISSL